MRLKNNFIWIPIIHKTACSLLLGVFLCTVLLPCAVNAEDKKPFRLGVIADTFSGVNQNDARIALNLLLAKHLTRVRPEYISETVIYPDLETAIRDARKGSVDLLTIPSMDFISVRDQIEMTPEFISGIGPQDEQAYVLLVNRSRKLSTLPSLKNKNLIVEKGVNGKLGLRWMDTLLLEQSLAESENFFNEIKRVDKSSRALLPVFFGQADGCIVRNFAFETMVELNPQVKKKLIVLKKSPVLGSVLLCFRPGVEAALAKSIIEFVEKMPDNIEHRQVLLLFQVKKIIRFQPEYLRNLEMLLNRYAQLKQNAERK